MDSRWNFNFGHSAILLRYTLRSLLPPAALENENADPFFFRLLGVGVGTNGLSTIS